MLSPCSPLRMRMASSTEETKIFPSPIFPDLAAAAMVSTICLHAGVGDNHVQLHFGKKVDLVFVTTIGFGVTFLAPVASHIGDRDSLHADAVQCRFHFIQLVRLNDGFNFFHGFTVLIARGYRALAAVEPVRAELARCRRKLPSAASAMPATMARSGAPAFSNAAPTTRHAPQKYFQFISRSPSP